jgi:hypothetical protein
MAPLRNLSEDEIYLDLIDEMSPGSYQDRRTILVRLDAGETQLKRLADRDGGGSFDEGLRAISTKSLEEQWQLLGTLEALNRMLLFGLRQQKTASIKYRYKRQKVVAVKKQRHNTKYG